MKQRFVFGLGLTLGFFIGAAQTVGQMMSVDEIRKACANRVANKISDFLYGKCRCDYAYDLRFATQKDCENAWHDICETIQLYGQITVAEVKEIAGVKSSSSEDTKEAGLKISVCLSNPKKMKHGLSIFRNPKDCR